MASTPKGSQKIKLDYHVDREIYDNFVRECSIKGYAPHIVIEKIMKKYIETGQI